MMERTLQSLIKWYGYWMALCCCTLVVWWTWFALDAERSFGFVKAYNIRYFGVPALIFGVMWILACISLVVAIYKESLFLLCPFASMFMIEFCMLLCRDVYLVTSHHNIDETILLNVSAPYKTYLPFVILIVPNIIFSLLALKQMFQQKKASKSGDAEYVCQF